jgi:hypothetical protein
MVGEDTNHGGSAKCFDRLSMTAQMVAENTNHGGNGRIECG